MDKPCLFGCEAAKELERENENIKDERAKRERLWLDHQRDFLDKNLKLGLENEKMRECLKYYANENLWLYEKGQACKFNEKNHIQGFDKARMALKELEAGE